MKLGLSIGYSKAKLELPVALVQRAEELGYDSVWSAEAYGSDAVTPLAFLAAVTKKIRLGTGIMQLAARTPANAAMCAGTIDALAGGGRFIAGLGVSGPQIVEGWYGQPWGRPYYRLKDYVAIMRKIFAREEPVTHDGREIALPYTGPGASGVGKPLKSILHMNPEIPIYLATGSESTVELTAEIADGWLPMALPQGLGSGRNRPRRGGIVGRLELLSEIRTEGAIVDGATNLKQQIGAASRPAHLLCFIHPAVHQEIGPSLR
jgi:F420-dependent oxidoreductase-like protein